MELFRIYESLDSTNKEASRLLLTDDVIHGSAIVAMAQTDGRGQYGRKWLSEHGNHLAMSIVLLPHRMMPSQLPMLSMKTSLAIIRSLSSLQASLKPMIKWPNDVYLGHKKLCGILIENSLNSTSVQHCILGIGMNINEATFPAEIPNATSLYLSTGKKYDIREIASFVYLEIMHILDEPFNKWKPEYDNHIYGKNQKNKFEIDGKIIWAEVLGVDHEGKMILSDEDQNRISYFSHEIKWVL